MRIFFCNATNLFIQIPNRSAVLHSLITIPSYWRHFIMFASYMCLYLYTYTPAIQSFSIYWLLTNGCAPLLTSNQPVDAFQHFLSTWQVQRHGDLYVMDFTSPPSIHQNFQKVINFCVLLFVSIGIRWYSSIKANSNCFQALNIQRWRVVLETVGNNNFFHIQGKMQTELIKWSFLTHCGQMTHICVDNLTMIGSDNGLAPARRQTNI